MRKMPAPAAHQSTVLIEDLVGISLVSEVMEDLVAVVTHHPGKAHEKIVASSSSHKGGGGRDLEFSSSTLDFVCGW